MLSAIPPCTNPSSRVGYSKQLRLEMLFFLLEFASGISFSSCCIEAIHEWK
jgi:hypothetical protein